MLYQNNNYKIEVGKGYEIEYKCYLIINKNTDVVEVESRFWPQAKLYADQLDESYEKEDKQLKLNLQKEFKH